MTHSFGGTKSNVLCSQRDGESERDWERFNFSVGVVGPANFLPAVSLLLVTGPLLEIQLPPHLAQVVCGAK